MSEGRRQGRQLPVGYYTESFRTVLDTVEKRYGDLLSTDERAFAARWQSLATPARRLYVRMIGRKGPLLRRDRLRYPEIPEIDAALAALEGAELADRAAGASTESLAALLLKAELGAVWRALLGGPVPARRSERLVGLCARAPASALRAQIESRVAIVRARGLGFVRLFRLLFFGTLRQDLSAFVLRDLGVVRYEAYALDREVRRWRERRAIDDALAIDRARAAVRTALAAGDLAAAAAEATAVASPERPWHPAASADADRVINRAARALERAGRRRSALALYTASRTPPARERRVRLLARQGRERDALALVEQMAAAPRDEQERVFAARFGDRLKRRLARRYGARPPRPRPRRRLARRPLELVKRPGQTVESQALDALGVPGLFAENWLWKSLFGLAFWDVIFAPVAGAFEHPFQVAPLDLGDASFRAARATLFRARLARLRRTPHLMRPLLATFDAKHGIANALVSWQPQARAGIELALRRLHGGHLAAVADRLGRDLRRYRTGFPDLFVLADRWPGFALFEVKAPGDALRAEQRGWLAAFDRIGIPATVLDVVWR